jgi:hypothetical protein
VSNPSESNPYVSLTVHGTRRTGRPTRREAMQWVMGVVAASALPAVSRQALGLKVVRSNSPDNPGQAPAVPGYGHDADLTRVHKPGDLWPLTFNDAQKKTAAALADTILPKDQYGPAASELGVVEMMDEWISAPYAAQQASRPIILEGLTWLEAESNKRFGKNFADLSEQQKRAVCDDICYAAGAAKQFKTAARFFSQFRSISASAYYATAEGWQAIGYVGNVALASFDGPPPEVLKILDVTQTVS